SHIELAIGEWQQLRIARSKRRVLCRSSVASVRDLILGRIDSADVRGSAAIDNKLGESARPATDIEPLKSPWQRQPVKEALSGCATPASHQPLVGLTVGKKARPLSHLLTTHPAQAHMLKDRNGGTRGCEVAGTGPSGTDHQRRAHFRNACGLAGQ